ncbi:MAG: IS91 family transposase [Acetobacteraceae bacterium]|nr:IS91 family transposase [Acetobacteraceae bacterium]
MIELAEVFRRFAADYLSNHGASLLPSHRRAIEDILDCRTAALGGQVWRCETCESEVFSYHSCGNRSCPKCHTKQTQAWLERRQTELLPVPYFHITITVPAELRALLRANQRDGYGLLMQACAAAIIELARDPRYVGGTVAVITVLHTWTQQLNFHPHVHCLVSGGGLSDDASTWHPARRKFLVPVKALAKLVRGKFRVMLRRKRPDLAIPEAAWRTPWILHVTAWGTGEQAVLDYLARYVFRVALTNARILGLDEQTVTIQYKERKSGRHRTCRLSGDEFMRRFLQHVLPRSFHKVRYFGLWHPAQRHNIARVRQMLQLQAPPKVGLSPEPGLPSFEQPDAEPMQPIEPRICPHCHQGRLVFIRTVSPHTPRQAMAP